LGADGLADLAEKTGCSDLKFLGWAAGEYVDAASNEPAELRHAGLDVPLYCHASSPLRRYADLVNQRILVGTSAATGATAATAAAWLQERSKEAKNYERELWCLSQLSATELKSADGWILGWKEKANAGVGSAPRIQLLVYVPAWKRRVKIILAAATVVRSPGDTEDAEDALEITADWCVHRGDPTRVTAFWDIRNTPEHRFVFRCDPLPLPLALPFPLPLPTPAVDESDSP
jgi:hypothetical protein